ncbi:hypothetical protein C7212DRAFT_346977 [Tuber magnatum]|uniref:Uncharacterized protein n=1 Tax=Tuber magnatum TaxID=42249 RepID=A0A317SHP5_9PEZI|nr:hypothetical protein C7212DRAFT_346977 [Tuber magnatum]
MSNRSSDPMGISGNPFEGMPGCYAPAASSTPPEVRKTTPQNPTFPSYLPIALPVPTHTNTPTLPCPVPSCALVFDGKTPYGYLWRHLRRPGTYRRTGEERDAWLHLHKIEHDRLIAAGITPAQRKREANRVGVKKAREQKKRIAGFQLRARKKGITEEALVSQKVAIWEGMHVAKQSGDSIGNFPKSLNEYVMPGDERRVGQPVVVTRARAGLFGSAGICSLSGLRMCALPASEHSGISADEPNLADLGTPRDAQGVEIWAMRGMVCRTRVKVVYGSTGAPCRWDSKIGSMWHQIGADVDLFPISA